MNLLRKRPQGRRKAVKARFEKAPDPIPLSASGIYRNLMIAPDGLWAWYELGGQHWRFKSIGDREAILEAGNVRWADLAGHRIHLLRDTRPFDYEAWARHLDNATPHPVEGSEDASTWQDYYVAAQLRVNELGGRVPVSYIGIRLTGRRFDYKDLALICSEQVEKVPAGILKTRSTLVEVTDTIAREGFDGKPLDAAGLGLLVHSMVGLGAPAPATLVANCGDGWAPSEMDEFTNPVLTWAEAVSKTTTVNVLRDNDKHTHHVAVLEVGKMARIDTEDPNRAPWMNYSDTFEFPVVWSAQLDIAGGKDLERSAEFNRVRAESVREHYQEHGETPPPSVERAIADARRIEDEVKEGDAQQAVRLAGPIYAAVAGVSPDDAAQKARTVISKYALKQHITLHHGFGQWPRYRAFIPGEPCPNTGFIRQLPAYYMPTAVPNVASQIGDAEGPYLGMCGHTPVMFDPTYGPRNDDSGLVLIGGGLGSGKSTLVGTLAEADARRNHRVLIVDPSGNLARLCDLPHLRDCAQHIELGGAEAGTLNPYWLVPEPAGDTFGSMEEHMRAKRNADAERRELAVDTFIGLLHPDFVTASRGRIVNVLTRVVNRFGGHYAQNPWIIVRELEHSHDELEREIGANLRDASTAKGASLIFPEDQLAARQEGQALPDAALTVITMRGMEVPKGTDKSLWNHAERMAAPALHLVSRYAMLAMYADTRPKSIFIDEAGIIAAGQGPVRSFLKRGSLETRKTNTMLAIVSQNPSYLLDVDPEIGNLIGAAFWGRVTDDRAAQAVMKMLQIPTGHGYEKVLRGLRKGAGDFLHLDWHGNVDRIVVDIEWRLDLKAALDATPKRVTKESEAAGEFIPVEAEGLVTV